MTGYASQRHDGPGAGPVLAASGVPAVPGPVLLRPALIMLCVQGRSARDPGPGE